MMLTAVHVLWTLVYMYLYCKGNYLYWHCADVLILSEFSLSLLHVAVLVLMLFACITDACRLMFA